MWYHYYLVILCRAYNAYYNFLWRTHGLDELLIFYLPFEYVTHALWNENVTLFIEVTALLADKQAQAISYWYYLMHTEERAACVVEFGSPHLYQQHLLLYYSEIVYLCAWFKKRTIDVLQCIRTILYSGFWVNIWF